MNDYYSDFPKPRVDERVQSLVSMVSPHLRMEVPLKVIEAEALHVTESLGKDYSLTGWSIFGKSEEYQHLRKRLEDWVRLHHQKFDERF